MASLAYACFVPFQKASSKAFQLIRQLLLANWKNVIDEMCAAAKYHEK